MNYAKAQASVAGLRMKQSGRSRASVRIGESSATAPNWRARLGPADVIVPVPPEIPGVPRGDGAIRSKRHHVRAWSNPQSLLVGLTFNRGLPFISAIWG